MVEKEEQITTNEKVALVVVSRYFLRKSAVHATALVILESLLLAFMIVSINLPIEQSAGFAGWMLIFAGTVLAITLLRGVFWIYGILAYFLKEFRPPYGRKDFVLPLPASSNLSYVVKNDAPPALFAVIFLSAVTTVYWGFLSFLLRHVSAFSNTVREYLTFIPQDIRSAALSSVESFTGIPIDTLLQLTDKPLEHSILVLLIAPFFVLFVLLSWNLVNWMEEEITKQFEGPIYDSEQYHTSEDDLWRLIDQDSAVISSILIRGMLFPLLLLLVLLHAILFVT